MNARIPFASGPKSKSKKSKANSGGMPIREIYRIFGPHLRPHKSKFVLSIVLVLIATAIGLLKPWPLKYLFDKVLVPQETGTVGGGTDVQAMLLAIVIALAVIALLDSLIGFARSYVLTGLSETVSASVRIRMYDHLQKLSLRFHEKQRAGDLLTRLTSDVEKVQSIITTTVIEAGANALFLVSMLVVMFVLDPGLSLLMMLMFPLLIFVVHRFRGRIKRVEAQVRSSEGDLASLAQETLASVKLVKAYGREDHEVERFRSKTQTNLGQEMRVLRVAGLFGIILDMITAVALAALVWLGAQRVLSGALTPGDLIIFTAYLRDVISPARSLSKLPAQLAKASVRAEKIAEVLDTRPEIIERPDAVEAPRLKGKIELRWVCFGYDRDRLVLQDVDLIVRPGQTVAVVGATGAGKSTLVGLLCRLYDPDLGTIHADGQDVREFTLASYQRQLAVVLQQTVLFHATVRENIAYGRPDATDEEIRAAARIADADGFITALPDGYDTHLGERGDTLSGGQRQRIAIARAVLRDARILILDEPTTGLDARSERDVLDAIERATVGRSTVIISHQLSAVVRADRIVVLHQGCVVEEGTHESLIAAGGRYAELARLQGLTARAPAAPVPAAPVPTASVPTVSVPTVPTVPATVTNTTKSTSVAKPHGASRPVVSPRAEVSALPRSNDGHIDPHAG